MIELSAWLEAKYHAGLVMSLVLGMAKRYAGSKAVTVYFLPAVLKTLILLYNIYIGLRSSLVR